jgi:hypothetical protein
VQAALDVHGKEKRDVLQKLDRRGSLDPIGRVDPSGDSLILADRP